MAKVQAHRGASAIYPDNTMLAFKKAYEMGADGFELDVYTLFDNTVVVSHDAFIYRKDEKKPIFYFDRNSIKQEIALSGFAAYQNEPLPYFTEILDFLRDKNIFLNVEIKEDSGYCHIDTVGEVMHLMEQYHMQNRSIISSFNHRFLRDVRERFPEFLTGVLYMDAFVPDMAAYCKQFGFHALHPWHNLVTPEYVEHAHKHGLMVSPWTVDDPSRMKQLRDWGVDYIISNDVALCRKVCDA